MNPKYLNELDAHELEQYAKIIGFTTKAAKTVDDKRTLIENRRNRDINVTVLGSVDVTVKAKRLTDKKLFEMIKHSDTTTNEEFLRYMVGDEGYDAILAAATDEDGTVDNSAIMLAVTELQNSKALKNAFSA